LHPNEQAILVNWYNSLTSKGGLNWDTASDLCGQIYSGVTCDSSNPQSVIELYCLFSIISRRIFFQINFLCLVGQWIFLAQF